MGHSLPLPVPEAILDTEARPDDPTDDWFRWSLRCPICRFDYVHLGEPWLLRGNDSYDTGLGPRGDVIRVDAHCENGHRWCLCLGFHKGKTYLFMQERNPDPETA